MSLTLRPYQSQLVERARASLLSGRRAPLLVAPCGSGKTVCFSYFAQRVREKGKRVLILAHREELLDQISATLDQFDVEHSFVAAGRHHRKHVPVQVASVFTLVRRLDAILPPDLIIIDEAHHAILGSTWNRVLERFSSAHRIGVTATPERLSGEPLHDVFDDLILGPSVKDLIGLGALSPYRLFAPASNMDMKAVHVRAGDFAKNELVLAADKPSITGDAIAHYRKLADGKRAVAFCVSIEHARHVAAQFRNCGYESVTIDGTLDRDIRKGIIRDFRDGKIRVLTSCDVISEGFDVPGIEVAIMLRPTCSLALWIQQTGRALRTSEGKDYAIILDHAGNAARHGLPDEDREWSLEGRPDAKSTGERVKAIRTCPMCFAAQAPSRTSCFVCNHVFEVEPRKVEHRDGELVEVDPRLVQRQKRVEQGQAHSFNELVELGKRRGMKRPYMWAKYVFNARQSKKLGGMA